MKGRQETKASVGKDDELYSFEYPVRLSPHAYKGRCDIDLAR